MTKNLSELKRFKEGQQIILVSTKAYPNSYSKELVDKGLLDRQTLKGTVLDESRLVEIDHKGKGLLRTIEKMQSNAIKFSNGSWLYFVPAEFFRATEKGFIILPRNVYDTYLEYEVVGGAHGRNEKTNDKPKREIAQ